MPDACPFCEPDADRVWLQSDSGVVFWDAFPVVEGHTLVVPRRHVASLYELPLDEQAALWRLVGDARQRLCEQRHTEGFNIGLNDGQAAGQTVMHAHIHLMPRKLGDIPDPRGGVRWIFPDKARYW